MVHTPEQTTQELGVGAGEVGNRCQVGEVLACMCVCMSCSLLN